MDKTFLDELVDYPAQALQLIDKSKECLALLLNKSIKELTEDDADDAFKFMFDYEYVDNTTTEAAAYIWVEAEVPQVSNKHIKDLRLYVTVACHKNFMKLKSNIISGLSGNRRDNLVRYIDKILNGNDLFGIGRLKLNTVKTYTSSNSQFTMRELCYVVPDFNIKEGVDEARVY